MKYLATSMLITLAMVAGCQSTAGTQASTDQFVKQTVGLSSAGSKSSAKTGE